MTLQISRVATFALTREKNTKQVVMKPYMFSGKLLQPKNAVLRGFIATNISMILNMVEEVPGGDPSKPALYVEDLGRRSKKRAYVLDFWKTDKRTVLRNILDAAEMPFLDLSKKIADWLKESDFWPVTYLFIAQFTIPEARSAKGFVAILLTRLSRGKLAEHEEAILQQIREGIIDPDIKKGHIFPHLIQRQGQLTTEDKVKSFEDLLRPADYFYDFLNLDRPQYAQNLAQQIYKSLKEKGKLPTLSQLRDDLDKVAPKAIDMANAVVQLDEIEIKVPLSRIGKALNLAQSGEGFIALAKGSKLQVKLGRNDLLADRAVKIRAATEVLDEFRREESD